MNVYNPLFAQIVDSSIWDEPYHVRILFTTMLAIKGIDHVARGTAYQLSKRANITEAEAIDGLKILASPDTKRLEPQPYEGRRIEKVDGGWLLLNGAVYQQLMRDANRRFYQQRWTADKRQKVKNGKPLAGKENLDGSTTPSEGSIMHGIDNGTINPKTLEPWGEGEGESFGESMVKDPAFVKPPRKPKKEP